ncbi:hypothetical protein K2X30_04595 [bacterium]|nr:hypothetical protein [bacterium]
MGRNESFSTIQLAARAYPAVICVILSTIGITSFWASSTKVETTVMTQREVVNQYAPDFRSLATQDPAVPALVSYEPAHSLKKDYP